MQYCLCVYIYEINIFSLRNKGSYYQFTEMSNKKEECESTLKMKFKRKRMFSEFIIGNKEGEVDMRNRTTKKHKEVLLDGNGVFKTEKKEYKFKAMKMPTFNLFEVLKSNKKLTIAVSPKLKTKSRSLRKTKLSKNIMALL